MDILIYFKFMIKVTEELRDNHLNWPEFHTKSILIRKIDQTLKFTNYFFQDSE